MKIRYLLSWFSFFFFFYGSEGVRAGWRGVLQQLHMVRGLPNAVIISPLRWKRTTRWMTYRSHSTADCNLLRLNWWSGNATQTLTHTKQKITHSHNNTKKPWRSNKRARNKKRAPEMKRLRSNQTCIDIIGATVAHNSWKTK